MIITDRAESKVKGRFLKKERFIIDRSETIQDNIMDMLRGLYKDITWAVVREYVTNALDSCPNTKVDITLPTQAVPEFTVRDYGPGMPTEYFKRAVRGFGTSDKLGDADKIGGFGIGCKCGLAYNDSYLFSNVWFDEEIGRKRVTVISCFLDNESRGQSAIMADNVMDEDDDTPTGVTVVIPLREGDVSTGFRRFKSYVDMFAYCRDSYNRINITNEVGDTAKVDIAYVEEMYRELEVNGYPIQVRMCGLGGHLAPYFKSALGDRDILIVMGGVPYPLKMRELEESLPSRKFLQPPNQRRHGYITVIDVGYGAPIMPLPSRESIKLSPAASLFIVECCNAYSTALEDTFVNDIDNFFIGGIDRADLYLSSMFRRRSYDASEIDPLMSQEDRYRKHVSSRIPPAKLIGIDIYDKLTKAIPDEYVAIADVLGTINRVNSLSTGEYLKSFFAVIKPEIIPEEHLSDVARRYRNRLASRSKKSSPVQVNSPEETMYLAEDIAGPALRVWLSAVPSCGNILIMPKFAWDHSTGIVFIKPSFGIQDSIDRCTLLGYEHRSLWSRSSTSDDEEEEGSYTLNLRDDSSKGTRDDGDVPVKRRKEKGYTPEYYIVVHKGCYEDRLAHFDVDNVLKSTPTGNRGILISTMDTAVPGSYLRDDISIAMVHFIRTGIVPEVPDSDYALQDGTSITGRLPDVKVGKLTASRFVDSVILANNTSGVVKKSLFKSFYIAANEYYETRPEFVKNWLGLWDIRHGLGMDSAFWCAEYMPELVRRVYTSNSRVVNDEASKFMVYMLGVDEIESVKNITPPGANKYLDQVCKQDIALASLVRDAVVNGMFPSGPRGNNTTRSTIKNAYLRGEVYNCSAAKEVKRCLRELIKQEHPLVLAMLAINTIATPNSLIVDEDGGKIQHYIPNYLVRDIATTK